MDVNSASVITVCHFYRAMHIHVVVYAVFLSDVDKVTVKHE